MSSEPSRVARGAGEGTQTPPPGNMSNTASQPSMPSVEAAPPAPGQYSMPSSRNFQTASSAPNHSMPSLEPSIQPAPAAPAHSMSDLTTLLHTAPSAPNHSMSDLTALLSTAPPAPNHSMPDFDPSCPTVPAAPYHSMPELNPSIHPMPIPMQFAPQQYPTPRPLTHSEILMLLSPRYGVEETRYLEHLNNRINSLTRRDHWFIEDELERMLCVLQYRSRVNDELLERLLNMTQDYWWACERLHRQMEYNDVALDLRRR